MSFISIVRALVIQVSLAVTLVVEPGCSKNAKSSESTPKTQELTSPPSTPNSQLTQVDVGTGSSPEAPKYKSIAHLPPPPTEAELKARGPEIRTMVQLLESRLPDATIKAMDLMDGRSSGESNEQRQSDARTFYNNYLSAVIQHGDDTEKAQAARLLRAMVNAHSVEHGSSRIPAALWNLLAPVMQGDMANPAGQMVEPSEQWLSTLPAYKLLLEPTKNH